MEIQGGSSTSLALVHRLTVLNKGLQGKGFDYSPTYITKASEEVFC